MALCCNGPTGHFEETPFEAEPLLGRDDMVQKALAGAKAAALELKEGQVQIVVTDEEGNLLGKEKAKKTNNMFYKVALGKAQAMASGTEPQSKGFFGVFSGMVGWGCCGAPLQIPGALKFTHGDQAYIIASAGSMDPFSDEACSLNGVEIVSGKVLLFAQGSPNSGGIAPIAEQIPVDQSPQ